MQAKYVVLFFLSNKVNWSYTTEPEAEDSDTNS